MQTSENGDPAQEALRLAQLEIKLLREQLLKANDAAKKARASAEEVAAASTAPGPPATNGEVRAKQRHVLCIEDSEANFQLIQAILHDRPGTDLVWAPSGRKGVELATQRAPQLVLLDLDLPDMHGSEVLAKLRATPATATTPVIVISADATPSQIERMLAAGANDYITKPFEIRRFLLMFDEVFP